MYALDTNSLVYFFKGMGRVAERLLATPPSEIAIPSVVLYELEVGLAKAASSQRRREQLQQMAARATLLSFGPTEARLAARIRCELESIGAPIGSYDILIAGTALSHGATLVTQRVSPRLCRGTPRV